ncbi:MAG TPA: pitrilysin family protein [Caulobacteraceae bacterium]
MSQPVGASPAVHTLPGGIRVICDHAPGFETLAVSVVAGRGARWEGASQSGWSHLLEHMVFKGAGGRTARQIVEAIEARGGQINAATGHERTSFQVRTLKDSLALSVELAADLILRPTLDAEDLVREKRVVAQELAEASDAPDDKVFELAQAAAFKGQPLGRPILGAPRAVAAATPQGLEAWRERLYAPDRLVVSAAGAVDEDALLSHVERAFAGATSPPPQTPAAAVFKGGAAVKRRNLEQAHVVFLLPAPGADDGDRFALRLFAEMLGGGMSSRLFQEARERLGLAYAIDAFAEVYADAGLLGVYAGCAAGDAGELARVAADQIRALAAGCGEAELARGKAQAKAGLYMSAESLASRAEQNAAQLLVYGRLVSPAELAASIEAVSPRDIARLGGRLLRSGRSAASVLGPSAALDAAARFDATLFGT